MGIYIYTLRKTSPIKTQLGDILRYEYSNRLSALDDYTYGPKYQRILDRHTERFERVTDCLVTLEAGGMGKPIRKVDGMYVYRQAKAHPIWFDCDKHDGEFVGVLRKEGRSWVVKTYEQEAESIRKQLNYYSFSDLKFEPNEKLHESVYAHICNRYWFGKKCHNLNDMTKADSRTYELCEEARCLELQVKE